MGGAARLEPLPVVRQRLRQRHLDGEEAPGRVAGGVRGGVDLLALLRREADGDRLTESLEERAHAPRELLAITRAVGHGSGQPAGPPPRDQRVEARKVHRLFDSLAQLRLDARAEVTRLAGVAAGCGVERRVGHQPSSRATAWATCSTGTGWRRPLPTSGTTGRRRTSRTRGETKPSPRP